MCSFPYIGISSVRSIDWENIEKTLINSVCGKYPHSFFCNSHHNYAFCTIVGECWLCKKIVVESGSVGKALLDDSREAVRVSKVKNYIMCGGCATKCGAGDWGEFVDAPHSEVVECIECGSICRPHYEKKPTFYKNGFPSEEPVYEKTDRITISRCQWCYNIEVKKSEIEYERRRVIKIINQVKKELKNAEKSNNDNGAAANCTV